MSTGQYVTYVQGRFGIWFQLKVDIQLKKTILVILNGLILLIHKFSIKKGISKVKTVYFSFTPKTLIIIIGLHSYLAW